MSWHKKELNIAFSTVQSQDWKKPLQSVHMAWLFLAQKLEENVFKKAERTIQSLKNERTV